MGNVIYLDVLIIINLFVNYFLFLATSFFLHRKPKRWRLLLAALAGGCSALLILFDGIPFVLMLFIKLMLAALLVLIAHGYHSAGVYIKTVLIFFGVNFVFAGAMLGVWLLFSPKGMVVHNGIVYFNISALALVFGTLAAYLAIRLIGWLFDNRVKRKEIRRFIIEVDGKQVILNGFLDTGNKLTDRTTGSPVVVCEYNSVFSLIPMEAQESFLTDAMAGIARLEQNSWAARIRMIPFSTVGGSGMMLAFRPDHFYLISMDEKSKTEQNVLIGVTHERLSHGEYQAVLSAAVL